MGQKSREALLKRNCGSMKNRELFEFKHFTHEHIEEAEKAVNLFLTVASVHDSMRLQPEEAVEVTKWFVNSNLLNGLSIGAFNKETGELVALGLMSKEPYGIVPDSSGIPECYQKQHRLQESVKGDIVSGKPTEMGSYMNHKLVVVQPEYAQIGLATELFFISIEVAKSLGCYEFGGSMSNYYFFKMKMRRDFYVNKSVRLVDYVDSKTGMKPFTDAKPPHDLFYWVNHILFPEKSKILTLCCEE